jgi:hypothetical protein
MSNTVERVQQRAVASDELGVGLDADQDAGQHDHSRDHVLKCRCLGDALREGDHGVLLRGVDQTQAERNFS